MHKEIFSKLAGVTFNHRQFFIKKLRPGQRLWVFRENNNIYDKNAIAVYDNFSHLGYIRKELAASLAPEMDAGTEMCVHVTEVTGKEADILGVNIRIDLYDSHNPALDDDYWEEKRLWLLTSQCFRSREGQESLWKNIEEQMNEVRKKDDFSKMLRNAWI